MSEDNPVHSPLGASSAERWINCPGSVSLARAFSGFLTPDEQEEEPEYRTLGTSAHEVAAKCLEEGLDAWELVGQKFGQHVCTTDMSSAVQVYLDTVRQDIHDGVQVLVEAHLKRPEHRLFYGTVDCAVVDGEYATVNDYKHGEGVSVSVVNNPQLMYYAALVLHIFPHIKVFKIRVVQPRFHGEKVKVWETTADVIRAWMQLTLLPAMAVAELDGGEFNIGPWCRFCPAKLSCPLMKGLFGAAATADVKTIETLDDTTLSRSYPFIDAVKSYCKALEAEIMKRLNRGKNLPGLKLVQKKANRVFKDGAEKVFKAKFGALAYTKPELKTPAEMEKIGPDAEDLVREYAYAPMGGLTVALADDSRLGIKVSSTKETFKSGLAAYADQA